MSTASTLPQQVTSVIAATQAEIIHPETNEFKPPVSLPRLNEIPPANCCDREQLFIVTFRVAENFRSGKECVEQHREYIIRLKTEVFQVSFGSKGESVLVKNPYDESQNRKMYWSDFCEIFFQITADWLSRILKQPKPPKQKPEKPAHLTQLEYKLLGSATIAHEAITDLRANRIDEAIAKLSANMPTQERIAEHLERGIEPTILNPEGKAEVQISTSDQQFAATGLCEPLYSEVLGFVTKMASSLANHEVRAEAKGILNKMLLRRPLPDSAGVPANVSAKENGKPKARSGGVNKLKQAEAWLLRYLKNGPKPIPDSFLKSGLCRYNYRTDELPPEGVGKKTIDKAIVNLRIERLATGPRGGVRWHLPESPAVDAPEDRDVSPIRIAAEVNIFQNDDSIPKTTQPIAHPSGASNDQLGYFLKKRVIRVSGTEINDFAVFRKGGDHLPLAIFDNETEALEYIANVRGVEVA
jgi:hypothetical protein